jgi:glycosyltransferase involved in cell wall biosynthesis
MIRSLLLLYPSLTASGGGIEQHARHMAAALAARFPDATIDAVLGREGTLACPERLAPGLRPRLRVHGGGNARARRIMTMTLYAARAAARRPRLVVAGHLNYAPLGVLVARAVGAPLWTVLHGVEAWRVRSPLLASAVRASDRLVAVSRVTQERAARALGVDTARISVLPNGVDTARFRPGTPGETVATRLQGVPRPRLLTVARLDAGEAYKGVDRVIRALGRLAAPPSYVVVGDGSDRQRLETLAQRLGVAATFFGHAADNELPDLYRACDRFVMPSHGEGFGYVFIEALASGLPVVAGNADGSVEALAGGRFGHLVDPDDVNALAAALVAPLAAPPRAAIETHFGLPRFYERVAALIASR